jgi:ABC-type Fe3+-siderophore transport system permease subunit
MAMLWYTGAFIGVHLLASGLLAVLVLYVFNKYGAFGLPGSHALVIVISGILTSLIILRRKSRVPNRAEFEVLYVSCVAYFVVFDAVIGFTRASAYPASAQWSVMEGVPFAIFIDSIFLYLSLVYPARWIMRRRAKMASDTRPNQ